MFSALSGPFGPTLGAANSAGGSPPVITTTSLPSGTVGSAYSQTLVATGTAPITWSIVSGSISPLTLNASTGEITGTPGTATTLTATFRATNAYGFDEDPLSIVVSAAGVDPVLVTAPVIALSEFNSSGTINTAGAVLEITPGTYFQDAPKESLSIQSVTRTTVAGYSRAWIIVLNTAFTTTLRNGFVFGVEVRRIACGIYSVSGDKLTLTLVSDNYSPSPNPSGALWNYQNVRVTTTTGAATTTTVTINPGYAPLVQVGDTVEIAGYPLTYVTSWDGGARIATVSPALSSAPTVGTAVTVVGEPKTTDGYIAGPPVQKSWQWYRDGVAISGANSRLYTTTNADSSKTVTAKEYAFYWDLLTGTTTNTSNSAAVTGSVDSTLITKSNFSYLGAFRVPAAAGANPLNWSGATGASGGRAVWYKTDGAGSLIISGRNAGTGTGYLTEISIPATLDTTGVIANMNRGSFLTPAPYFFEISGGNQQAINPSDANGIATGGAFIYNGNIYQSFKVGYAIPSLYNYFKRTGTSVNAGTASGPFAFNAAGDLGYFTGPVCSVPAAWQAALGGPMLQGSWQLSNPEPQGNGPLIASFDPDTLGASPATINLLASYTTANPLSATPTDGYTNWARSVDFISGMAFPTGSKTVLTIGRHGIGRRSYGTPQRFSESGDPAFVLYNPVVSDKGWHSYPFTYAVYAYNADDLAAAKAGTKLPYQVKPYAVWSIEFPGQDSQTTNTCSDSACFDSVNNRLFFLERESPRCQTISEPIIHVFQLSI